MPGQPPTVLVVETNYLVASTIEAPLLDHGYLVRIAFNVEQAQLTLAAEPIHLALIDFRLQHGGPEGLVAELNRYGVPFIFCTAATREEVHEHFPAALIAAKPFSDAQLWSLVESVARGHSVGPNPSVGTSA